MAYPLAGHRWSVVTLLLAATVALAAEWISRAPSAGVSATRGAPPDIDTFLAMQHSAPGKPGYVGRLESDPLADRRPPAVVGTVAPRGGVPTVSSSGRRGRRLTAILISDDRSVAVIDEMVVSVGDKLPDGARVDAIRSDRVSVVERNGQRRVLTLTTGRQ
jgi:hypothetical protein